MMEIHPTEWYIYIYIYIQGDIFQKIDSEIAKPSARNFIKISEFEKYPKSRKSRIRKLIFKNWSRNQIINFRSISLISKISKIFDKLFNSKSFLKKSCSTWFMIFAKPLTKILHQCAYLKTEQKLSIRFVIQHL